VDEDEDIQLCQLVSCTKSWSSTEGKVSIWWNWLLKSSWIKSQRILEIFFIVVGAICCPQNLQKTR